jgi:hypothetical protein
MFWSPLKSFYFGKIHIHCINKIVSFATHYGRWWQAADIWKKPLASRISLEKLVWTFLPASSVGEQKGGEELAVVLSPWQPLVKLLYPGGRPHTIKMWDVVAQLAKATGLHQTEDAAVPGSNPAPPTVSWTGPGGQEIWLCIIKIKNLSMWGVSAWVKNSFKKLKSAVCIPQINKKMSPAPGIKSICGPGTLGKTIFTLI